MRTLAREIVFKYVFSTLFIDSDKELFDVLKSELNDNDKIFASKLLDSIETNKDRFLTELENIAVGYKVNRLYNTDKCALLVGMAELVSFPETDLPIIIDEAVKLCAKYSTERSTDFVNGILAKFAKNIGR